MNKDSLLEKFESFKLEEPKSIIGGRLAVLGYSQEGGNSYVDYVGIDGEPVCNELFCNNDASDWFDNFNGQLESFPCP